MYEYLRGLIPIVLAIGFAFKFGIMFGDYIKQFDNMEDLLHDLFK